MKILPRNSRTAKWFPYQNSDRGWIHFERRDRTIAMMARVPYSYFPEIRNYWMQSETVLYSKCYWNENSYYFDEMYRYEQLDLLQPTYEIGF